MLLCISKLNCFDHDVVPACGPDAKTCEFNWTVDYLETMVVFEDGGRGYPVVLRNGTLMKRTSCDTFETLSEIGKTIFISYFIHDYQFFFLLFQIKKKKKLARVFAGLRIAEIIRSKRYTLAQYPKCHVSYCN